MELAKCAICGAEHDLESMELGYARCDAELVIPEEDREKRCWGNKTDFLQIDTDRWFIRCWLPIPVIGRSTVFGLGVWAAVDHDDFWTYVRMYRENGREIPPFPGRIANQMPMYGETLELSVSIQMASAGDRPIVTLVDERHPLGLDQRNGITVERVLALLHRA